MARIDAQELELFAVNTGELYQLHLTMARSNASQATWREHVQRRVLPLYSRQVEPAEMTGPQLRAAAEALRAHYAQHITEF
jgi:hypothetical protein